MNPYKGKDLKKFLESIPPDVVERETKLQYEEDARIYKEFIKALKIGKCFLCGEEMTDFNTLKKCFHWFTYPKGIRKTHFKKYLRNPVSFLRLDIYLRWLANTEKPFVNINDLKDDTSKGSYYETTIKYKNIEWAFSIGHTDKDGHPNSQFGSEPHYHIQMKVDGRIFIKFGDFHIRFTDDDLFHMELKDQVGDMIKRDYLYGTGMGIIEDDENLKMLNDSMTVATDEKSAPFRRQTFISAPFGKAIKGEMISRAIEESKKTKEPVGKILERLLAEENPEAKVSTIISPSDAVPDMIKRSGKK